MQNLSEKTFDFIVVGQGIAGSLITHFLLQQNKKVLVIDKFYANSSSNIAAGVVNPITGRKMVKSWLIDEVLPFAKETYRNLENQLQTSFFYEQDIYKILTSKDDVEIWHKKEQDEAYKNYLGNIIESVNEHVESPFGVGIIKQCCWMDVPVFIDAYRKFILENELLIDDTFDFNKLNISDKIVYKNIVADNIIFCEGYKAYQNPYFNFVEFSFAKGEQFNIYAPDLCNNKILNKNIFILPKKDSIYTVGSTFVWNDLNETVTEDGKKEIIDKLEKIINCNYKIIDEKAGIRPTIKDRRPVVGAHPNYSNLFIFNGLGTKGVSLSPYFSSQLVRHIIFGDEIEKEINVKRFYKKNVNL